MKSTFGLILVGVILGTSQGQGIFRDNWLQDILSNVNQMTTNIQQEVHRLNSQIQKNVHTHLAQIDNLNKDVAKMIGEAGNNTLSLSNTGSTILISGEGGVSKTVYSGTSANGQPYFRASEDRISGNILNRTERVYNPTTGKMDVYRYTLDLNDPNAKPVPIPSPK